MIMLHWELPTLGPRTPSCTRDSKRITGVIESHALCRGSKEGRGHAREGEREVGVDGGAAALGVTHGEGARGRHQFRVGGPGLVPGHLPAAEQRPEAARACHVRRNPCCRIRSGISPRCGCSFRDRSIVFVDHLPLSPPIIVNTSSKGAPDAVVGRKSSLLVHG